MFPLSTIYLLHFAHFQTVWYLFCFVCQFNSFLCSVFMITVCSFDYFIYVLILPLMASEYTLSIFKLFLVPRCVP
jgi:hypothetical protein